MSWARFEDSIGRKKTKKRDDRMYLESRKGRKVKDHEADIAQRRIAGREREQSGTPIGAQEERDRPQVSLLLGEQPSPAQPKIHHASVPGKYKFTFKERRFPREALAELLKTRGWKSQFQLTQGSGPKSGMWAMDLKIVDQHNRVVRTHYAKFPSADKDRAANTIANYALFNDDKWLLWERLHEPYRSAYMSWAENRKKSKRQSRDAGGRSTVFDDSCSLGSFNTGFSMVTKDVPVNASRHMAMRTAQRNIEMEEQQRCLKYGQKTTYTDGKTLFELGRLRLIKQGQKAQAVGITVYRFDKPAAKVRMPKFTLGEVHNGIVQMTNTEKRFGFITSHKGDIFFHLSDTVAQSLPAKDTVVSFQVSVSAKSPWKATDVRELPPPTAEEMESAEEAERERTVETWLSEAAA